MTTKPTNPKERFGSRKVPMSVVPPIALQHVAVAMAEGALKYSPYNWRESGVRASIYYDATMRHLMSWWEGEDTDPDSGLSHLAKAMASLMVLLDGNLRGVMEDDRPPATDNASMVDITMRAARLFDRYSRHVVAYDLNRLNELFPIKPETEDPKPKVVVSRLITCWEDSGLDVRYAHVGGGVFGLFLTKWPSDVDPRVSLDGFPNPEGLKILPIERKYAGFIPHYQDENGQCFGVSIKGVCYVTPFDDNVPYMGLVPAALKDKIAPCLVDQPGDNSYFVYKHVIPPGAKVLLHPQTMQFVDEETKELNIWVLNGDFTTPQYTPKL